tara:strand:+ start:617 stop:2209 length:1593 start_codon:yes stop_codon:yes gene_type:complete
MLWAQEANADEIEEVLVVGQQEEVYETKPTTSSRLISSILPAFTYNPGGYGGFIGYNEKGTQTVHTSVFVNGIPSNEPGSGWYNFGHDIVSGERIKVISGANGVLYGSGSIAGTVLIQDTIDSGMTIRLEDEINYIRVAPIDQIQFVRLEDGMDSVRNDNDEEDNYEFSQFKTIIDAGDWTLVGKYADYTYDYDNCYDAVDFSVSNDCVEDGERYNVSIRNKYLTIGRSYVNSNYFTKDVETYTNESYTDYLRVADTRQLSNKLSIDYGMDAEKLYYKTTSSAGEKIYEDENFGLFFQANASFVLDYNFGVRLGNDKQNALRLGMSKGQFFLNVGNSFRKPTLYELFGDNFVLANPDLKPEEGIGYEIGYGVLSLYRFEFDETIEYQDGFVMGDVFVNPQYFNAGDYVTQGIKFNQVFGPVRILLMYNDTDQPRAPKYSSTIDWRQTFKDIDFRLRYAINLDRLPSEFDVLPEGETHLEDLQKLDFYITKKWDKFTLAFKVENVTNEVVEVVPFYENEGREFYLTFDYNW